MPTEMTDRLTGLSTSVAIKPPCRLATISNVPLVGLFTHDGVALAEGDRVLVRAQTAPSENGIRIASVGPWVRAADFDGARDVVQGTIVLVRPASDETLFWEVTSPNPIVVGTSDITFAAADPGMLALRDELEGVALATEGAGMLGYSPALPYSTGVGQFLNGVYARTAGEIAAGVTPTLYWFAPGDIRRYGAVSGGAAATNTTAIQAALDSNPGVFAPPGNFSTNAALQFNSENYLFGSGSATQFYPTHNGPFMVGKAVTPSSGTDVRRYSGGGQNFMIYGPGVASTSSIGLDLRGCTAFKFWNVRILNFATGVRQGDGYSTYYNEFHACDISTATIGYHNTSLGNGNKVYGGRLSACTTCTLDGDNSGSLYNGVELEVFTTGHKTIAPTTQFIRYRDSRVENPPTSGVAFDIDPDSEDTQISGGQVVSVTTIITESSPGVPTGRRTRVSLSEYESIYSGKKISFHTSAQVTKDIASLAAGASRQEAFTVPGVLTGSSVVFTAPLDWPALVAGPCIVGGTDLVYMMIYNPTGSAIDAVSMTFNFDVWRH